MLLLLWHKPDTCCVLCVTCYVVENGTRNTQHGLRFACYTVIPAARLAISLRLSRS